MRSNKGMGPPRPRQACRRTPAGAPALLLAWTFSMGTIAAQGVDCPAAHPLAVELGPLLAPDGTVKFQHAHAIGAPCPQAAASADSATGTYSLTGGGADIWQQGDQFLFAYNVQGGDFSIRARVADRNFAPGSQWGKFGLMARQDCGPLARYTMVDDSGEDPQHSIRFTYRANLGPGADGPGDDRDLIPPGPAKHADVLRLDRIGNVVSGHVLDATGAFGGPPGTWRKLGEHNWGAGAPPVLLVGPFVNSHQGCDPATITFADYQVLPPPVHFRRGDADGDGRVTLGDAAAIAARLASEALADLSCLEAADADDDGAVTPLDAAIIADRVLGTLSLPAPGARLCGADPRDGLDGALGCAAYAACDGGLLEQSPAARLGWAPPAARSTRPDGPRDIEAMVLLEADDPVQAWSLAIQSTCIVDSVATAGTAAAPAGADPAGRILSDGFQTARVEPDGLGVVAAAALSTSDPAASLEAGPAHALLRLLVSAASPFGGCQTCKLDFDESALPRSTNAVATARGSIRPLSRPLSLAACCPEQAMEWGGVLAAQATVDSPSVCVRLPPPPRATLGQAVRIQVAAPGTGHTAISVFARWGDSGPTALLFDGAARERGRPLQTLVLPDARPQPLGILIVGDVLPEDSGGAEVLVSVEPRAAGLESITPAASAPALVRAVVTGGRFTTDMSFALVAQDGVERTAFNVTTRWIDEAVMDFDLNGAAPGAYDLVLRRGGADLDRLPAAYRVNRRRHGGVFEVEVDAPRLYRNGELARLTVRYGNAGDEPLPAPLVQLGGPTGVFFSLTAEDLQADHLQLLAAGADGSGALSPGARVEVPVYFQIRVDSAVGATLDFIASALRPDAAGTIDWASLPWLAALPAAQRPAMAAGLEQRFRTTWPEYERGMAQLAGALALRGEPTSSAARLFDFAAREAVDQPLGGITGQVLSVDGAPVDGAVVAALAGGVTRGVAQSVGEGKFTVNWLTPGARYDLAVDGYKLLAPVSAAAVGLNDSPELVLATTDISTQPSHYACPPCQPPPLPGSPPALPATELVELARGSSIVVTSHDPNTKTDEEVPGEGDPFGAAQPGELIVYRINFENERVGSAPAKKVIVSDLLDPRLDPATFCFLDVGFGCHRFSLDGTDETSCPGAAPSGPYGSYAGQPTLPIACSYQAAREVGVEVGGRSYCVRVRGELVQEQAGWCAVWRFETFLPGCSVAAAGALDGFLPPDDCPDADVPGDDCTGPDVTHDSEGFVSFAVRARADLAVEDDIVNEALIKFDSLDPLRTPAVVKPVSLTPESATGPIPAQGAVGVPVAQPLLWQPAELAARYEVYLWKVGEPKPALPTAEVLTGYFAPPGGLSPGTDYRWQVVAVRAGRRAPGAEWSFQTAGGPTLGPRFVRGDSDSSGAIDITDVLVITGFLFLGQREPQCLEAAEANRDGSLDLSDAAFLAGWLFLGGPPPPAPSPRDADYLAPDCALDPGGAPQGCATTAAKCR